MTVPNVLSHVCKGSKPLVVLSVLLVLPKLVVVEWGGVVSKHAVYVEYLICNAAESPMRMNDRLAQSSERYA